MSEFCVCGGSGGFLGVWDKLEKSSLRCKLDCQDKMPRLKEVG